MLLNRSTLWAEPDYPSAPPAEVPTSSAESNAAALPLLVDLDALLKTDLLTESLNSLVVSQDVGLIQVFAWRCAGRRAFSERVAQLATLELHELPYHKELLSWLYTEKAAGRHLVLVYDGEQVLAERVAAHLDLFDETIFLDEDLLKQNFKSTRFEYVGSRWKDLPTLCTAVRIHVISSSKSFSEKLHADGNLGRVFSTGKPPVLIALTKALRPHQWTKNLLVFVALLGAHRLNDLHSLMLSVLAFVAFGLIASSIYVLNDLLDIANDRHHQSKRLRPFAAGDLSLGIGWTAWPTLLVGGIVLAALTLPIKFNGCLMLYGTTAIMYSLFLKQLPIADVITLAMLYTLRVVAGAAAVEVELSFWLLSSALFGFLSLAMIKRYSELVATREAGLNELIRGRGYRSQDLQMLASLGGSAGNITVLVIALYIHDSQTSILYTQPQLLWPICPLLLFWMTRAWFISHRGKMHDDPIVFALKDPISLGVTLLIGTLFVIAS